MALITPCVVCFISYLAVFSASLVLHPRCLLCIAVWLENIWCVIVLAFRLCAFCKGKFLLFNSFSQLARQPRGNLWYRPSLAAIWQWWMTLGNPVVKGNVCSSWSSRLLLPSDQLSFKEVDEEGRWPCPVLYWKEMFSSLSPHGGRSPFSASYGCQKLQQLLGLKCAADALLGAKWSASIMPPARTSGRTLCRLPSSLVAKHHVYIWPLNTFKRFVIFSLLFLKHI